MAPKADIMKTVEDLQWDVSKIAMLEKNVEEFLGKMSILERIEQHMKDETLARKHREEVVNGFVSITNRGKHKEGEEESSVVTVNKTGTTKKPDDQITVVETGKVTENFQNEPLTRKIEIPIFDGENGETWVLRVEHSFELGSFTKEEKLCAVMMCFDDEALLWYRWESDQTPFLN